MWLVVALVSPVSALPSTSDTAGTGGNGLDYMGSNLCPPNVVFAVDMHTDTLQPCGTGDAGACRDEIGEALQRVMARNDWARFGLILTTDTDAYDASRYSKVGSFWATEPDGSVSGDGLSMFLQDIQDASSYTDRNLTETLGAYIDEQQTALNLGDAWGDAHVHHTCQDLHLVVLTKGPSIDDAVMILDSSKADIPDGINDVCCSLVTGTQEVTTIQTVDGPGECDGGGRYIVFETDLGTVYSLWFDEIGPCFDCPDLGLPNVYAEVDCSAASAKAWGQALADAITANIPEVTAVFDGTDLVTITNNAPGAVTDAFDNGTGAIVTTVVQGSGTGAYYDLVETTDQAACDAVGGSKGDTECRLDNVARYLSTQDMIPVRLAGTQRGYLHTIFIDGDDQPNPSFEDAIRLTAANAAAMQSLPVSNEEINTENDLVDALMRTMMKIRGISVKNAVPGPSAVQPKLDTEGDLLVTAWSEPTTVGAGNVVYAGPRTSGHLYVEGLENDPTSAAYGFPDGSTVMTDAGAILASRPENTAIATNNDFNVAPPNTDRAFRNIYTYSRQAEAFGTGAFSTTWLAAARQPFDSTFVSEFMSVAVGTRAAFVGTVIDANGELAAFNCGYEGDLSGDCALSHRDLDAMVQHAHGLANAQYPWGDTRATYGLDRLAGFAGSMPTIVDYDTTDSQYSTDPSYAQFLKNIAGTYAVPFRIVLIASEDGMVHAFSIDDPDPVVWSAGQSGDELWAWIPETVLVRNRAHAGVWLPANKSGFLDQIVYGRQILMNGTVQVADVWIDQQADGMAGQGAKGDCTVPGGGDPNTICEWRRVAVVQQGDGGNGTLVLDITDPLGPKLLNEWYPTMSGTYKDGGVIGSTTSRPVIAHAFNDDGAEGSTIAMDRPMAIFGSGRPTDIREWNPAIDRREIEPTIHMMPIIETKPASRLSLVDAFDDDGSNLGDWDILLLPGMSTLDPGVDDTDMEYAGIQTPLAMVDVDGDGDPDTAYFAVTKTFRELVDGGALLPYLEHEQQPSTDLYKACRDTGGNPDFWKAVKLATLSEAAEVAYAPTVAWFDDGSLGLFVATGTPYELDEFDHYALTDDVRARIYFGYDEDPASCGGLGFTLEHRDTVTSGTACTTDEYYELPYNTRVVGDPVVYGGYLFFTTWGADTNIDGNQGDDETICTTGTGSLIALDYMTCGQRLDLGEGATGTANFSGFPSNIAITDFGTLIVKSTSGTGDPNPIGSGAIRIPSVLYKTVKEMNFMQVF